MTERDAGGGIEPGSRIIRTPVRYAGCHPRQGPVRIGGETPGSPEPCYSAHAQRHQGSSVTLLMFKCVEKSIFVSRKLSVVVRKVQPTLQLPPVQPTIWHNERDQFSFVKDFTSNPVAGRLRAPAPGQPSVLNRSAL